MPVGPAPRISTLLCVMLHSPKRIIVCEKDESRLQFLRQHYPQVLTVQPEDCAAFVRAHSDHGGADVVLEVAGADSTFRLAWECARPNAIVTVVALYDKAQTLSLIHIFFLERIGKAAFRFVDLGSVLVPHPVEKIHVAVLAALAALDAAVPWIPDVVQEAHLLSVPIIIAARTGNKSTPCAAPSDVIRLNKI